MGTKEIVNGIDTFEKGVDEIQKLGNVVENFNQTINHVAETLMIISDQQQVNDLKNSCIMALEQIEDLKNSCNDINQEYDELIGLSLYKDNLLEEVKNISKEIKSMRIENKKIIKEMKKEMIGFIQESMENISVKTEAKVEDVDYYRELANKYMDLKEYQQAAKYYNKIINLNIEQDKDVTKEDYLNRAKVYELLGEIEKAMLDYKQAINN